MLIIIATKDRPHHLPNSEKLSATNPYHECCWQSRIKSVVGGMTDQHCCSDKKWWTFFRLSLGVIDEAINERKAKMSASAES